MSVTILTKGKASYKAASQSSLSKKFCKLLVYERTSEEANRDAFSSCRIQSTLNSNRREIYRFSSHHGTCPASLLRVTDPAFLTRRALIPLHFTFFTGRPYSTGWTLSYAIPAINCRNRHSPRSQWQRTHRLRGRNGGHCGSQSGGGKDRSFDGCARP